LPRRPSRLPQSKSRPAMACRCTSSLGAHTRSANGISRRKFSCGRGRARTCVCVHHDAMPSKPRSARPSRGAARVGWEGGRPLRGACGVCGLHGATDQPTSACENSPLRTMP
jgi:hypothetical protein